MQYLTGIKSSLNDIVQSIRVNNKWIKPGKNSSHHPSNQYNNNKETLHGNFSPSLFLPNCVKSPDKKVKSTRKSQTTVENWSTTTDPQKSIQSVDENVRREESKSKPLFEVRHRLGHPSKQIESEIPEVGKPEREERGLDFERTTLSVENLVREEKTRDLQNRIISYSSEGVGEGRISPLASSCVLGSSSKPFRSGGGGTSGESTLPQSDKFLLGKKSNRILRAVTDHRRSILSSLHIYKAIDILSPSSSTTLIKMDHEDLMAELPQIEKLSNQERLRLAHKRRLLQLKRFQQYDKEIASRKHKAGSNDIRKSGGKGNSNGNKPGGKRIRFRNSIQLLEAAGRNDVDEVRRLLSSGVSPDVCNEDGLTALHQCCIDDNEEMMKLLLDYGANVNSEDSERWTPLHAAATCGHLHLVKYLIAKGANLLAINADLNMPFDICDEEATLDYVESEMAKRGVTQDLIEETRALPETIMLQDMQNILVKGGDLEFRDVDGATPLHIAAANGYYRVVELLLDNHVATDVVDKDNWQPIHAAACWGHVDVLELLVQNGADLNARTRNNETPYAICEDPEIKERIILLRSEQENKQQEAKQKRLRRTQSSNSRTQSIRRTSQRDKGLTSKRDTAHEAQMLMAREDSLKNNSPSPTADVNGGVIAVNNHNHGTETTSSEEDMEDVKSLPPAAFGRDSIPQIKVASNEMERLQSLAAKGGSINSDTTPTTINNNLKSNNVKNNNINSNINNQNKQFSNPISLPVIDTNANLPKPEINPPIDNKVQIGSSGISLSGSRDSLVGVGNGTIDIHVSVTINTNSPSSTLTNGGTTPYISTGITPGSTLLTPPGTLSDLKKHRSLIRTTSNPLNNGTSNNVCCTTPSSYKDLVSYPSCRRYPSGFSQNMHNNSLSVAYEQACCNWDMNYSQSEFDSSSFAYAGSMISHSVNYDYDNNMHSSSGYAYNDSEIMHSNTNHFNNQVYINNLTGVLNDHLPHKSYEAPPSPTVSLQRFVGEPTEIGDYGDGGKKCCIIV